LNQILFEENGDFKAGTVLSEAGASLQVELATGRRVKIKAAHVMLRFDAPAAGQLIEQAQALAQSLDAGFLWECAPQDEFSFADLAKDYFGTTPSAPQSTAMLLRLHAAPIHFQRKGRGRYRPAPAETVSAALAGLERRRQQELRIEALAEEMVAGRLPAEIARQAAFLLARPDKTSLEYRALEQALRRTSSSPERLLMGLGAFDSTVRLHLARFAAEHFPAGIGFDARHDIEPCAATAFDHLPLAQAAAFSIDDSSTTEIDDALSVQARDEGGWRVGIHIAAPGLGISPGSRLDEVARERMSSVYMPGDKITMLPQRAVGLFSLDAGRVVPALSLYLDIDPECRRIERHHSRLERVAIADNLRHDEIGEHFTEASLTDPMAAASLPQGSALAVLWRLTLASCSERERVRGKPEPRFRTDFSFRIERVEGRERVRIETRRRDAPLDRIVAEMMILANSLWGQLLAEHQVPGIYRSQQAGRVRMSTHALPHEGLGVQQYIWSTSPLRRYVDLVNQRQLIAVLGNEQAPYGPRDASVFAVISGFESRHTAYQDFQQQMERLWCLRWLDQEQVRETDAVVVREDLVRLVAAPLYFRLAGPSGLAPGRPIRIAIDALDEIDLSLQARYLGLSDGILDEALGSPEADEEIVGALAGREEQGGASDQPAEPAAEAGLAGNEGRSGTGGLTGIAEDPERPGSDDAAPQDRSGEPQRSPS
jgi:exoribonuclease-2